MSQNAHRGRARPATDISSGVRAAGAGLVAAVLLLGSTGAAHAAPGDADTGPVRLVGEPLVHHFDLDRPGDAVTGQWQVVSSAVTEVPYDGIMTPTGHVSEVLARALTVQYGVTGPDGRVRWHDAGTIADPVSYGQAIGRDPAARAGGTTRIPVRVSLPDTSAVAGDPGQRLSVQTTFALSYLEDPGDEGTGPDLALTGLGPWVAALAAALLALGGLLRRRRRD